MPGRALYTGDLTHADDSNLPTGYTIPFPEFTVQEGETYQLNVLVVGGEPVVLGSFTIPVQPDTPTDTPLINIGLPNNNYGGTQDDLVVAGDAAGREFSSTRCRSASPRPSAVRSPASSRRIWATRTTTPIPKCCA
ncbi:MAG: hypothetical protein U0521_01245 [Anaerolineae bacterium]